MTPTIFATALGRRYRDQAALEDVSLTIEPGTDWTLALFFRRETAQLTSLEHPADDFRDTVLPVPEDPVEVTEALSPGLPGGPMKPPGGLLERPGAGTPHQRHRARRQRRRRNEGISR